MKATALCPTCLILPRTLKTSEGPPNGQRYSIAKNGQNQLGRDHRKRAFSWVVNICFFLTLAETTLAQETHPPDIAPLNIYVADTEQVDPQNNHRQEFATESALVLTHMVSYGVRYQLSKPTDSNAQIYLTAGVGEMKTRSMGVSLDIAW